MITLHEVGWGFIKIANYYGTNKQSMINVWNRYLVTGSHKKVCIFYLLNSEKMVDIITSTTWRVTQVMLDISAHYPWAMGLFLGDVHLSELKRVDKPCAIVKLERLTIRSSVKDAAHSVISSPPTEGSFMHSL